MNAKELRTYQSALEQARAELANHDKRGEELRAVVQGLESLLAAPRPRKKPGPKPGSKARKKPGPKPRKKPGPKPGAKGGRPKAKSQLKPGPRSQGAGHPEVSPSAFRGLGTTKAYRRFLQEYGDGYTPPQIRDALIVGGLRPKSRSGLLTAIHGIIRRDRIKAEKEAKAKNAAQDK